MSDQRHIDPLTLAAYALGELDAEESAVLRAHLETCGRCQAEADLAADHFRVEPNTRLHPRSESLANSFARRLSREAVLPRSGPNGGSSPTPVARWRGRASWWLVAAAVVFAGIGLREMMPASNGPLPTGVLRGEGARGSEVQVERGTESWILRCPECAPLQNLEVSVVDDQGEIVFRSPLSPDRWEIPFSAVGESPDSTLHFVRIRGVDDAGRRWESPPVLLP